MNHKKIYYLIGYFGSSLTYSILQQLPLYVFNVWMYGKIIHIIENGIQIYPLFQVVLGTSLFLLLSNIYCRFFEYNLKERLIDGISNLFMQYWIEATGKLKWNQFENTTFHSELFFYMENSATIIIELMDSLVNLISSILMIVLTGRLVVAVDPILLVVIFLAFLGTFIGNKNIGTLRSDKETKQLTLSKRVNYFFSIYSDAKAIRDIRSNHLVSMLSDYQQRTINNFTKLQKKENKKIFKVNLGYNLLVSNTLLQVVGPLILSIRLFLKKSIDLATFVAGYNAFRMLFQSLSSLLGTNLTNFFFQYKRIFKLYKFIQKLDLSYQMLPNILESADKPCFKLTNFSFRYPKEVTNALNDINLSIDLGEKVLITGPNGSGKSTLLKVLLNQYDSKETQTLGNFSANRQTDGEKINYQPQSFYLYPLTLKENVSRSYSASTKAVQSALQKVGFFIENLQILERPIGKALYPNGYELSGGQTQRVVLSRTFMDNSKEIFFFDEPFSQLDEMIQNQFKSLLTRQFERKTVVMVSHSLDIASLFDKIVIMQDGRIIDQGNHEEMLRSCELYKKLYTLSQHNS